VILQRYRHIFIWMLLVAFISFVAVYIYMIRLPGDLKNAENVFVTPVMNKVIGPEVKITMREWYAICQKYRFSCGEEKTLEGTARAELNNLTEAELQTRFPESAGWKIIWEEKRLIIEHTEAGLCPEHQKRWHLLADETGQKVAIFLGPGEIGKEGGLVRVTDIKINGLPANLQEKIKNGSLEFLDWDDLIATLDSLAE